MPHNSLVQHMNLATWYASLLKMCSSPVRERPSVFLAASPMALYAVKAGRERGLIFLYFYPGMFTAFSVMMYHLTMIKAGICSEEGRVCTL